MTAPVDVKPDIKMDDLEPSPPEENFVVAVIGTDIYESGGNDSSDDKPKGEASNTCNKYASRASEASEALEYPQKQPHGIFELHALR